MLSEKRIHAIKRRTPGFVKEKIISLDKNNRSAFTYEMGNIAKRNKAETSLKGAKEFIEHIRSLL